MRLNIWTSRYAIYGALAVSVGGFILMADTEVHMQCRLNESIAKVDIFSIETMTIPAPDDAPDVLERAGKFITGRLTSPSDYSYYAPLPAKGQLIQGFSALKVIDFETFAVLSDNGFGTWRNSGDAMLMYHKFNYNLNFGTFSHESSTFLTDPYAKAPFLLSLEGSDERYLTGRDFDPESFSISEGKLYIGEEFGPHLLEFDLSTGVLSNVHYLPDTFSLSSPENKLLPEGANPTLNASRGFEGMDITGSGDRLTLAIEAPRVSGVLASATERKLAPLVSFDLFYGRFSEMIGEYPLRHDHHSVGDIAYDDKGYLWVIERDQNGGDPSASCSVTPVHLPCFDRPAQFKQVFQTQIDRDTNRAIKVNCLDLMDLPETPVKNIFGKIIPGLEAVTTFPFVTPEGLDWDAQGRLWLVNDNNYTNSTGWLPGQPDENVIMVITFEKGLSHGE